MVYDVFNAYADAIQVATTLRAPVEPLHMLDNMRFAKREADRRRVQVQVSVVPGRPTPVTAFIRTALLALAPEPAFSADPAPEHAKQCPFLRMGLCSRKNRQLPSSAPGL